MKVCGENGKVNILLKGQVGEEGYVEDWKITENLEKLFFLSFFFLYT